VTLRQTWDNSANAIAARVCCGLASLHGEIDFRATAVISTVDYATAADRLLSAMSAESDPATYGIVLAERLDLK
jgi:hypothetical protein